MGALLKWWNACLIIMRTWVQSSVLQNQNQKNLPQLIKKKSILENKDTVAF
jgi:hypothetical protein